MSLIPLPHFHYQCSTISSPRFLLGPPQEPPTLSVPLVSSSSSPPYMILPDQFSKMPRSSCQSPI